MKRLPLTALAGLLAASAPLGLSPLSAQAHGVAAHSEGLAAPQIMRVAFTDEALGRKAAISLHEAVLEAHWDKGYLLMSLTPAQQALLQHKGFALTADTAFAARMAELDARMQAAGITTLFGQSGQRERQAAGSAAESIPQFPCYETVEETFAAAAGFAAQYPKLATWSDVGDSFAKASGGAGYDMMVLKLTNSAAKPVGAATKPILLIDSAIHGREYATAPLALAFARQLLEGHGKDADISWILNHHEIHFLLHANPDGRKKAEGGAMWRKNVNGAGCKSASLQGVDLNRNFDYTWNAATGGSSGAPCAEDYRGASAGSEPETQAITAYMKRIWRDNRGTGQSDAAPADTMGLYITIHSNAAMILWPWGETKQPTGNGVALTTMGRKLAHFNGYYPTQAIGLYPTDGSSRSQAYGDLGVASFTLEIGGNDFFLACNTYTNTIKPSNLKMLMYAARTARAPYVLPAGPDVSAVLLDQSAATTGVTAGTPVTLTATAVDGNYSTRNGTEAVQAIASAQVFMDVPPWSPKAKPLPASAADGAFNAPSEGLTASLNTTGLKRGKHMVYVQAKDAAGNAGPVSATFLRIR